LATNASAVILCLWRHTLASLLPSRCPTRIGRGTWIGAGARIIGSVDIGDNAIVGAGAVVVRDVAPGSIVAGVPAKVIGTRELPARVWHFRGAYFSPVDFELVPGGNEP
jgi:acetyltransferase-like isoleucine patch superfamily enzyme